MGAGAALGHVSDDESDRVDCEAEGRGFASARAAVARGGALRLSAAVVLKVQRVIQRRIKIVKHRAHGHRTLARMLVQHLHHERHELRWCRLHGAQLRNWLTQIEHALQIKVRVVRRLSGEELVRRFMEEFDAEELFDEDEQDQREAQ